VLFLVFLNKLKILTATFGLTVQC